LTLDTSTLGDTLTLQVSGVPENRLFVLARVLSETGYYGFQPVERLITDGQGNLAASSPGKESGWPASRVGAVCAG
jgi:hypothetical protein